jgi:transposase
MVRKERISSVLELSRYKTGETVWWVVFRNKDSIPDLDEEQKWMVSYHPKVLYERGPYQRLWNSKAKLPKLQHMDFAAMTSLLTSEFRVEPFTIVEVIRSRDTAEFFYSNSDDEWMPESSLFCTDIAARRERNRIMRLLRKWATSQST